MQEYYIIILILGWILLFTFNIDLVKVKREWEFFPSKTAPPDPLKCLIYSTFFSIGVFVIIKIVNYERTRNFFRKK